MAKPIGYFHGRPRPVADWIIPEFLKRGNTAFIIGQPKKACKSWLLLNLAWDLSDSVPVWGVTHSKNGPVFQPPRPMRVVYFTQEDTEDDVQDRAEIMIAGGRKPNNRLWVVPKNLSFVLDTTEKSMPIQSELDAVVQQSGPIDLIIFDPMRRMHGLDENDSGAMARIWAALDVFQRRYNCAVIFSHHIIKPPTAKGSTFDLTNPYAARGSGDIFAAGDAFANVIPYSTKGQPTTYQCEDLHFVVKRTKTPTSIRLQLDFTTGAVSFVGFI